MIQINISKNLQNIIDDLNDPKKYSLQNYESALRKLKILSNQNPKENSINELLAKIYFKKMDWKNAIKYYDKILFFNKEKFKIYLNIGVAFFKLGKITSSISSFEKSIEDNANFDLTYNNLAISYLELGNYKKAMKNFIIAIKLNEKNHLAQSNLIRLFNITRPANINTHPLLKINFKINKISDKQKIKDFNKLENIKKILNDSDSIIENYYKNLFLNETQIYRKNSKNLDCKRHFKVFNKFNIIPKFCFSCYKVQINLKNIIELIKLYFVFDDINLENNNIRKCIVEIRDKIAGNYKGYVYCSSLNEAKIISDKIGKILKDGLFIKAKIQIKHGCSEFYESFPEFKKINFNGNQKMRYNQSWNDKENIIDNEKPERLEADKKIWSKTLKGINLSDILIIKNWISYAAATGDDSYKLIYDKEIKNNMMNDILQEQLNYRKKDLY